MGVVQPKVGVAFQNFARASRNSIMESPLHNPASAAVLFPLLFNMNALIGYHSLSSTYNDSFCIGMLYDFDFDTCNPSKGFLNNPE